MLAGHPDAEAGKSARQDTGWVFPSGHSDDTGSRPADDPWLIRVAERAARHAGVPGDLLGAYLSVLADAALTGRRPGPAVLAAIRELGRRAAEREVAARRMVDLYIWAAADLWRTVPAGVRTRGRDAVSAAAEAVLYTVDDAVAALIEGYDAERRGMIRREEVARSEFIDDLLRGDSDVAGLAERGEPFGLDFSIAHQVAVATSGGRLVDEVAIAGVLERSIAERYAGRDVLVTSKEGQFVIVAPGSASGRPTAPQPADVGTVVREVLDRTRKKARWQVAAGRAYPGVFGVARSYEEAREALRLSEILQLPMDVVRAHDLLVYRVLARDQAAISDLVQAVLGPLANARSGAEPLLSTLATYYECGEVATETARRMHVAVRTVTYRLARIAQLTGYDPNDPGTRFALHVAVLGARLLRWPERELPPTR